MTEPFTIIERDIGEKTFNLLLKTVCSYYNLPESRLFEKGRYVEIKYPRHILIYLFRLYIPKELYTNIWLAKKLNQDRTNINHALNSMNNDVKNIPDVKREVNELIILINRQLENGKKGN